MESKSDEPAGDCQSGLKETAPDSTSTCEHSHEPFLTFQEKIVALAAEIRATGPVEVKRLRGGSYNRVIPVTMHFADEGTLSIAAIFRIPRHKNHDEDYNAETGGLNADKRI
jgi:hypothetical protein